MAEKPIKTPLPADLPEDWNVGQTVAPDGTAVGLTEQHGYNYLMAAVNRAQRGVNAVNEAFETVRGKRTCRFVIGTSAAGWTEADCDYLCDGADDQVEIQAAVNALPDGGEIFLLDGTYQLSQEVDIYDRSGNISLSGNSGGTVIRGADVDIHAFETGPNVLFACFIEGITFENSRIAANSVSLFVRNCRFIDANIVFGQAVSRLCEFLCSENEFHLITKNEAIAVSNVMQSTKIALTITNNIIRTEKAGTIISAMLDFYSPEIGTIQGNTIICNERSQIHLFYYFQIIGNTLYNCDIFSQGSAAIAGNFLVGGDIVVDATTTTHSIEAQGSECAAVTGNCLRDGIISVTGNVSVTGNSVVIISLNDANGLIQMRKSASNSIEDQFPAIVGNYVAGGLCGILLEEPGSGNANKNCRCAMVNSNRIWGSQTPIRIGQYWSGCMVTDNLFTTGAIEDNGENNIIRFNSDDTSGGGSTPATVQQATPTITVNADGTVTAQATQAAGYVAAGTRSATHKLSSSDDTDLMPENIKDGVSIFGVAGTLEAGGGTAGVTSFNGRSGAVVPASGDYTAAMVGARASDWMPSAADVGAIPSGSVQAIQAVTQAEYDALTSKSSTTLYLIKE